MELKIINAENKEVGKQKLPEQFEEEIRPDMIKRAVEAVQANKRQQYGSDPRAGKKTAARLSRRRRDYKGAYGKGLSRVPRKTMTRRGMQKPATAPISIQRDEYSSGEIFLILAIISSVKSPA